MGSGGTYLCEDAELVQGTLWGHGGGAGEAGGGRGVGCGGGGGGMVALLDQVWEVVDAARKAVSVRVLCGVMVVVVVMMEVRGAGGVVDEARARAGTWGKSGKQAGALAGVCTLSVVTCTLEVERGVDDFGSRRVPDEFRGGKGVSYSKGHATVATLQAERKLLLVVIMVSSAKVSMVNIRNRLIPAPNKIVFVIGRLTLAFSARQPNRQEQNRINTVKKIWKKYRGMDEHNGRGRTSWMGWFGDFFFLFFSRVLPV